MTLGPATEARREMLHTPPGEPAAARLARNASLEINALESAQFQEARDYLLPGQRIYLSHLPGQTWARTLEMCRQVVSAGCTAVPHIPVRLLEDAQQLDQLLRGARAEGVAEALLISGDYPQARGPYADVMTVLRTGQLQAHGFTGVSLAGHPEGHPVVALPVIRQAQIDKARYAATSGLRVSIVTQFFFDARPFVDWAGDLRRAGVDAQLVAGLAGPTSVVKLLKLARRCGVGPSIRALAARPAALLKLMTEQDPAEVIQALADAGENHAGLPDGIHLFSFGGFRHTARWLCEFAARAQAAGAPLSAPTTT